MSADFELIQNDEIIGIHEYVISRFLRMHARIHHQKIKFL